jgi:hypothetical protein
MGRQKAHDRGQGKDAHYKRLFRLADNDWAQGPRTIFSGVFHKPEYMTHSLRCGKFGRKSDNHSQVVSRKGHHMKYVLASTEYSVQGSYRNHTVDLLGVDKVGMSFLLQWRGTYEGFVGGHMVAVVRDTDSYSSCVSRMGRVARLSYDCKGK